LAVALASPPALGARRRGAGPVLFLFDHAIRGAAAAADRTGIPTHGFHGDVGMPWVEAIEPIWRHAPRPIAGITDAGALFCLEQLGRHYGMTCMLRLPGGARLEAAARSLLQAAEGRPIRRRAAEQVNAPVAWLLQPIGNQG
jgi:hypothetical protein